MDSSTNQIYFGGPDLQPNLLRDTLVHAIHQTPSGGEISWICYYLNDRAVLEALVEAARRNVDISIIVDANPRIIAINQSSINFLEKHAQSSIKLIAASKKMAWEYVGVNWHPHFHSKVYYFSHPTPHAFVGSYNPTAGQGELPIELINEIGDHSISHNVLVDIVNPFAVRHLKQYLTQMYRRWNRTFARLSTSHNQPYADQAWTINFLPSLRTHPALRLFDRIDPHATVKCAISHLKGPGMMRTLTKALKRSKNIEILLDSTNRRVSKDYLSFLRSNQIKFHQPNMPEHCLMHNKFILSQSKDVQEVLFGSFNWSTRSRYLNHEIVVSTTDAHVVKAFSDRWNQIMSAI